MRLNSAGTIAFLLALFAIAYFIWGGPTPSETFRYKLTINVRVNGVPYSASSVIEATQRVGSCLLGNARCVPRFSAKGVAPMIMLPDGAVIFASLIGHTHRRFDGDQNSPLQGFPVSRLPWNIYLDRWPRGNTLAQLPDQTPRMEIPFEGHPKSNRKPSIWYVPPQQLGPPLGYHIGPGMTEVTGRAIVLDTFVLEPTDERLVERRDPPPPWISAFHGGPSTTRDERRQLDSRIPRFGRQRGLVTQDRIETSKLDNL